MEVNRLLPADAVKIVDCFHRVYGASYANELFYDADQLAQAIDTGRLRSVGAFDHEGSLIGHMAMTILPGATTVELGNTVVDPRVRGQGVAWQVGAALTAWCVELGYPGYLHYPTTDHHIMQRQSVKKGYEIGLMLGYIPRETDGQVTSAASAGRQAATIVYEPLKSAAGQAASQSVRSAYLAEYCSDLLQDFARTTGLERDWLGSQRPAQAISSVRKIGFARRRLTRLNVELAGDDLADRISEFELQSLPCRQIDFNMDDPAIDHGVAVAREAGYWFCGWLPGYSTGDVFRMQKVERVVTDMNPNLVNSVARRLLELVP